MSNVQIDLDIRGRRVVIFGDASDARGTLRHFCASGATVTLAAPGAVTDSADRISGVRYAVQPSEADVPGLLRLIEDAWLVVDVELSDPLRRSITDLAAQLQVLMINELPAPRTGQVTLVGGHACPKG